MTFRVHWPTQYGIITQRFGENPSFYQKFGLPGHEGIDFQAPEGSEIYAAADGLVHDVQLDGNSDPMHKPYGNQVRIQHADGYESIYAHLLESLVVVGQSVSAGQLIALAGNTGNSSGAHLHLTMKKQGATESGATTYPHDIVDPTPYLEPFTGGGSTEPPPPAEPTFTVVVESPAAGYLNVRAAPYLGSPRVARVQHGDELGVLEEEIAGRAKVGQHGQWLRVRIPGGETGYVAAWYVVLPLVEPPPPETPGNVVFVVVDSPEEPLKLRSGPGLWYPQIGAMPHGTVLKVLEPEAEALGKIGRRGEWLNVRTPEGMEGYTAAWYVELYAEPEPIIPPPGDGVPYVQVESPELGLRVREGPGTDHPQVWWVPHGTVLASLEDPEMTGQKIGQRGEWIRVRTPAHKEGHVAAWYVRRPVVEDTRLPAENHELPKAISPHIFGIHAVTLGDDARCRDPIRDLYAGSGKRGWIFFTESVGHDASRLVLSEPLRDALWAWADLGYGVIVRLNHGYEPLGTLPDSYHYPGFAAACARWVELYLRHPARDENEYLWTIQIANEQNNPREHPGGCENPIEHITPELYARAFNAAYARIKGAAQNTIVCPGAVDPYNAAPLELLAGARWRPLDYYQAMLDGIEALDGLILHAYTHGPSLEMVTHTVTFQDPFLADHYFDFQTYRLFMERIPAKWKSLPVYLTETNHICRPPGAPTCHRPEDLGWINANTGWVHAVYAEVNSWNERPHAQQIRAVLLYRWLGDAWSIHDKPGILQDFRQALVRDYRWRAPAGVRATSFAAAKALAAPGKVYERVLVAPDDLRRIWGVGPRAEQALNAAGILIFEQLAAMTPGEIRDVLNETGYSSWYASNWPEQARLAAAQEWDALRTLQEELGRRRHG